MNTRSNNVVPLEGEVTAADQACQWIVRIDAGPLSPSEREELQQWLASDPAHASLLDTHALLWSAASKASFKPHSAKGGSAAAKRISFGRPRFAFAAIASVFLATAMWSFRWNTEQAPAEAQFATSVGEHRVIPLEDGSQMSLNTASAVKVRFSEGRRQITLERGEGLFEVAKDKARPFEVRAGSTVVRAIGTRFTVRRLDDGQVKVAVFEGVVELVKAASRQAEGAEARSAQPEPIRLGAGQVASEDEHNVVLSTRARPELEKQLAWLQGRVVFDNEPLAEVLAQVSRYSTYPLRLTDPALQDLRVSGAFAVTDLPSFIKGLELGFDLRVERQGGAYMVSRKI